MDKNYITSYQQRNPDQMLSKSGSTIYRTSWKGDRWGCNNCSKTYDKWGMIDHLCINKGRNFTEPPRGATGRSTTATAFAVVDDNKFCKAEREVNTKDMSQITELSAEAKQIIQRNIEARQQSSKFVKLQPGEKKILTFVPEKTEQVQAEFNGKKSLRFRYTVREDGSSEDQEKYFEVSKRTSEDIDTFLMEGHTKLKINRSGSGVDTRYLIVPV
jgi:hypothetical protein